MTPQVNDRIYALLGSFGFTGALNDRWRSYLKSFGLSGTNDDMLYSFLGQLGYEGSLTDRWNAYLAAVGGSFVGFAKLYLNFADGTNILDPRITFSRTTNATVTNSAGQITYAPHNLLTYSEQFDNAAWLKSNVTVSANSTIAPNNTTTADQITSSGANGFVYQTFSAVAGNAYTFSCYVKSVSTAVTLDIALLNASGASGISNVAFTTTGEWTRVSVTGTSATTQTAWVAFGTGGTFSTNETLYVWGAQLEIGSTATTYNPTTVKNLLGFSELFDNAAWTKSNSFVQTNGITYSEALDNAAWTKSGTTITANNTIAPNGYQTADKVVETATTARHFVYPATYAVVTGNVYTVSFYAKAAERSLLQVSGSVYTGYANIDLSTGTQVAGTSSFVTITPDANGFYKIVYTFTSTATSTSVPFSMDIITNSAVGRGLSSYAGDGTSGIYVWGFQLVQGSVAGDYRRTDAAALPVYYPNHNGVVCAEKFVVGATTGQHYMTRAAITGLTTGANQTISIYAKAGERDWLLMYVGGGGSGTATAYFNLATGTLGTVSGGITSANCQIIASGNGYYRCSITTSPVSTSLTPEFHAVAANNGISNTGDGTSGIYIFGAQLSDSASLDPYVLNAAATPTAAAYYGARFDYDPVTLAPKGLLIEEQRANLLLNSSLAGTNLTTQSVTVTAVAHTLSFYGTGTVTLTGTANTSLVGTGAYPTRSTLTFTPTAGTLTLTVTGTVQYAQLEIGSFATSFIPTAASQVTRTADVATIQGSNFYSWWNINEGSIFSNSTISHLVANKGLWSVNTDNNNRIDVRTFSGNINIASTSYTPPTINISSTSKSAYGFSTFNYGFSRNGGNVSLATTPPSLPIVNRLVIGSLDVAGNELNGTIKQISYYPQRLNNDTLKGLTA